MKMTLKVGEPNFKTWLMNINNRLAESSAYLSHHCQAKLNPKNRTIIFQNVVGKQPNNPQKCVRR